MSEYSNIKYFIKKEAIRLGFSKVGFAKAEPVTQERSFNEWIQKNYHADMAWIEKHREKRFDPTLLVEDCKTVIVFAANYFNPITYDDVRISRYVMGDDYHLVLKEKLNRLFDSLKKFDSTISGRSFVDTAPILERYWAQKAGIGWQGKNTNLITRDFGSYVFLAEILINIELEPDQEHQDFCGTCSKCLNACPTDAFSNPYQLDSNKCISYITIEYRDELNKAQENQIENHLYGCDICQEVCPWNKFAKTTQIPEFQTRLSLVKKNLDFWSNIDTKTYQKTLQKSAMKRAKISGLKRNAKAIKRNKEVNGISKNKIK